MDKSVVCDTNVLVGVRLNYSFDIPDSIIAATAKYLNAPLATADA